MLETLHKVRPTSKTTKLDEKISRFTQATLDTAHQLSKADINRVGRSNK